MAIKTTDLPPYYQDQAERKLRGNISTVLPDIPGMEKAKEYLQEKDLQQECEHMLVLAGYRRLTQDNISRELYPKGWFAHWPQAIGNPIMPDLVVWNADMTRTLMVELKVHKKFSRAQKTMITSKRWRVAFSPQEFSEHLNEWEKTP